MLKPTIVQVERGVAEAIDWFHKRFNKTTQK
jgi:hypothetical protein